MRIWSQINSPITMTTFVKIQFGRIPVQKSKNDCISGGI